MIPAQYPSLRDRVAFVSGGATGLGREFVTQLAAQGARVAFVDVDEPAGRQLVEQTASAGGPRPLFLPCDVTDVGALQRAIARCAEELGPISVLVNNAADDRRHKVADTDVATWDASFAVNLRPQRGTRGDYRVTMRHGVSRLRSGRRHTLGILFHDAA